MKLSDPIKNILLHADAKALASMASEYPHVVPVSTIKIVDAQIVLVNYFLGKTLANIQKDPHVSLVCWKGLEGYQIKAVAEHRTDGKLVTSVTKWVADMLPDRIVRGVLLLTPQEIYDISATAKHPGAKVVY